MLSSIKTASERQATIDAHNQTVKPLSTQPEQSQVIVNHFEKILRNWLDLHGTPSTINLRNGQQIPSPSRPAVDERTVKEVSIPILPAIDSAKYDEWTTLFTNAGYIVNKDQHRFTVSMP